MHQSYNAHPMSKDTKPQKPDQTKDQYSVAPLNTDKRWVPSSLWPYLPAVEEQWPDTQKIGSEVSLGELSDLQPQILNHPMNTVEKAQAKNVPAQKIVAPSQQDMTQNKNWNIAQQSAQHTPQWQGQYMLAENTQSPTNTIPSFVYPSGLKNIFSNMPYQPSSLGNMHHPMTQSSSMFNVSHNASEKAPTKSAPSQKTDHTLQQNLNQDTHWNRTQPTPQTTTQWQGQHVTAVNTNPLTNPTASVLFNSGLKSLSSGLQSQLFSSNIVQYPMTPPPSPFGLSHDPLEKVRNPQNFRLAPPVSYISNEEQERLFTIPTTQAHLEGKFSGVTVPPVITTRTYAYTPAETQNRIPLPPAVTALPQNGFSSTMVSQMLPPAPKKTEELSQAQKEQMADVYRAWLALSPITMSQLIIDKIPVVYDNDHHDFTFRNPDDRIQTRDLQNDPRRFQAMTRKEAVERRDYMQEYGYSEVPGGGKVINFTGLNLSSTPQNSEISNIMKNSFNGVSFDYKLFLDQYWPYVQRNSEGAYAMDLRTAKKVDMRDHLDLSALRTPIPSKDLIWPASQRLYHQAAYDKLRQIKPTDSDYERTKIGEQLKTIYERLNLRPIEALHAPFKDAAERAFNHLRHQYSFSENSQEPTPALEELYQMQHQLGVFEMPVVEDRFLVLTSEDDFWVQRRRYLESLGLDLDELAQYDDDIQDAIIDGVLEYKYMDDVQKGIVNAQDRGLILADSFTAGISSWAVDTLNNNKNLYTRNLIANYRQGGTGRLIRDIGDYLGPGKAKHLIGKINRIPGFQKLPNWFTKGLGSGVVGGVGNATRYKNFWDGATNEILNDLFNGTIDLNLPNIRTLPHNPLKFDTNEIQPNFPNSRRRTNEGTRKGITTGIPELYM